MADANYIIVTTLKGIDRISAPMKAIARTAKATGSGITHSLKGAALSVANSFDNMARRAETRLLALKRKTDMFGKGFKNILATGLMLGGVAGITGVLLSSVKVGMDFEQTMTNAAAKFPGAIRPGTEAFLKLENIARQLGASTEFTSSQAAQGFNYLAMAGFNAEQSIAALPAVVDLATAAQVDLARATDIATDTLGAMGLATKDPIQLTKNLARVNDVLAKTVVTSNTDMEQLFETITTGGPIAISAGSSIEQYAAMAGLLANNGIKASVAGTTLKNVFTRLAAVTPQSAAVLKRLGVSTKDAQGNLRNVTDIFADLSNATKGLGSAQRLAALQEIFGKIPLAGVVKLMDEGADKIRDYTKEIQNSTGASKIMAEVMRSTVLGEWKNFESAAEGVQITLFKLSQGSIKDLFKSLTNITRSLDAFLQANPWVVSLMINITKIVAPTLAVAAAIGVVNLAVAGLTAVLAMNPFTFWLVAITALIAAIITFRKEILGIGKIIIAGLMMPLWGLLKLLSAIPGIGDTFSGAANGMGNVIDNMITSGLNDFNGNKADAKIATPETAAANQMSEITKNNQTTNKLVIEDNTGKAKMVTNGAPDVIKVISNNSEPDMSFMGA